MLYANSSPKLKSYNSLNKNSLIEGEMNPTPTDKGTAAWLAIAAGGGLVGLEPD